MTSKEWTSALNAETRQNPGFALAWAVAATRTEKKDAMYNWPTSPEFKTACRDRAKTKYAAFRDSQHEAEVAASREVALMR
jgi:hypothetical protein